MTIGQNLQAARKSRGLSQEQLADLLGISRQAISKWERDDSAPDAEKILALSDALGVSCDALLRGADRAAPPAKAPVETPAAPDAPKKKRAGLICGIVFSSIGALGLLAIFILSTMIESVHYYTYQDANGSTWYTSGPGYSLEGFIEVYHLQALLAVFGVCLAVGVCIFLCRLWKRFFGEEL